MYAVRRVTQSPNHPDGNTVQHAHIDRNIHTSHTAIDMYTPIGHDI